MATKKQGLITTSNDRAVHLRPFGKQRFWSQERVAEGREIEKRLRDLDETNISDQ